MTDTKAIYFGPKSKTPRSHTEIRKFRLEHEKAVDAVMKRVNPRDGYEELLAEQLAIVVAVMRLAIQDMEKHGLCFKRGRTRGSYYAYSTSLTNFLRLMKEIRRESPQEKVRAFFEEKP